MFFLPPPLIILFKQGPQLVILQEACQRENPEETYVILSWFCKHFLILRHYKPK
jgi:hypothetical protein